MSRVVFTIGVFDLFHQGHKDLFHFMGDLGEEIVVGIHDRHSTFVNKGIYLTDPLPVRVQHVMNQPNVNETFIVREPNPGNVMKKIIKDYKSKGHKLVYVRGNDWTDFPGREVLEKKDVPIVFKEYSKGISSTKLRKDLDDLVHAIYNALTDESVPDEAIIPLFEEALFMPSDAVMRKVYKHLYDDGHHEVFGERIIRLSRLIGHLWSQPESKRLIPRFINRMGVNVDELDKNPLDFSSLNAFFARSIDLSKRPVDQYTFDPMTINSPSDGLILTYQNLKHAKKFYIKGRQFSLAELLDNQKDFISIVKGGPMVIVRLQPRDVHRVFTPLPGEMGPLYWTGIRLHTVKSEIVARQDVDVFSENVRVIVPFYNTPIGTYLFIAVGAPLIGSIIFHPKPGDKVEFGQELGYFEYGGSSIVLLFPPKPSVEWEFPLDKGIEGEMPVRINQTIGRIKK